MTLTHTISPLRKAFCKHSCTTDKAKPTCPLSKSGQNLTKIGCHKNVCLTNQCLIDLEIYIWLSLTNHLMNQLYPKKLVTVAIRKLQMGYQQINKTKCKVLLSITNNHTCVFSARSSESSLSSSFIRSLQELCVPILNNDQSSCIQTEKIIIIGTGRLLCICSLVGKQIFTTSKLIWVIFTYLFMEASWSHGQCAHLQIEQSSFEPWSGTLCYHSSLRDMVMKLVKFLCCVLLFCSLPWTLHKTQQLLTPY